MAEAPKEEVKKEEENDKKLIVISGITSGIGAVLFYLF